MSLKALQDYTFVSKNAQYLPDKKRRETWTEAVYRVRDMHLEKYKDKPAVHDDIIWAFEQVKQKKVLGSQRALQFGGQPILKKNARIYNCISSYCDRPRFFQECLWLLLCGCGVGFSTQIHHIDKLPGFVARNGKTRKFVIQDSIEGWSDALGVLIASYIKHEEFDYYEGYDVEFDFSKIRAKGSSLSYCMGKAPGPDGLRNSFAKIKKLLDERVLVSDKLRPIDCYDIVMHASDAVLSGGIRRSATICLFSLEDKEMMEAKTGNWFTENPQRGRSNNSVVLLRDEVTKEQFKEIIKSIKEYGEPGFYLTDSKEHLPNPCVEIGFWPVHEVTKETGWQACVSGDTKLITKDGLVSIKEKVNKNIEIWNGQNWKIVKPFVTGHNRKLYRVTLGDGSYLDCTGNHKWLIKDRFQKNYSVVETKNLLKFSKYAVSTPLPNIEWNGQINEPTAYELGFILGDGCCTKHDKNSNFIRQPFCTLFDKDHNFGLKYREIGEDTSEKYSVKATNVVFDEVNKDFCHKLKYEKGLPKEIFQWDRQSCYDFLAGWIDSDGTKASRGFRIYGEEDKIRDAQLLLTKLGFYSSVNLMAKAGEKTNLAVRRRDVWYLQVADTKDLYSKKVELRNEPRKTNGKGLSQTIQSVTELEGLHTTYCVNEPETNRCVFGTVLTKQCNLTEGNGDKIKDKADFKNMVKAATIIGTIQAGYTDFPYLGKTSEDIIKREALLGVSITGIMHNTDVILNPDIQKEMAEYAKEVNKEIADKIGINQAARITCVKPAGTTSCILGTSSGIHPHHAKRYIRRVQANKLERPLAFFKSINPMAVEESVWSANKTDDVVLFCVEVPTGIKTKNCITAIELLEQVKLTQVNWVKYGKNKHLCTDSNLSHNVSNTVTVKEDEWDDVTDFIYRNKKYFSGISLLPASGDKDYAQAPFTTVHMPTEIVEMYGDASIFASGMIESAKSAFNNNLWKACDVVLGLNDVALVFPQIEWKLRAKNFADKYFDGDVKRMTYCLKDVANWYTWVNLNKAYKDVDYSLMTEDEDNTEFEQESACAGGGCLV